MSYLYEFPTIIINQRLFDMDIADCYTLGMHAVTLSEVRDFKSAILYLPGEDNQLAGTTLIYRSGDRFFVTVPYEDVRTVFLNAYTDVSIYPYTNCLQPLPPVYEQSNDQ